MKALLIFTLFLFHSCDQSAVDPIWEEISFKPTQCANPWDEIDLKEEANQPKDKFIHYLKVNGITEVTDFEIKTDNGTYCAACQCLGGETYIFKIKKTELSLLKNVSPFDVLLD